MCGGALKWKETNGSAHFMEAPKCLPIRSYIEVFNTPLGNLFLCIAFVYVHKIVPLLM